MLYRVMLCYIMLYVHVGLRNSMHYFSELKYIFMIFAVNIPETPLY